MRLFKKRDKKLKEFDFQKTKKIKIKKPKVKFVWSRKKSKNDFDISDFTGEVNNSKQPKKKIFTEVRKKILLVSIILIFMVFTAYNISMYLVYHNYNKTSDLTKDIDDMMKEVGETSPLYERLENMRAEVGFMTAFCYDKEIEDKGDVLN